MRVLHLVVWVFCLVVSLSGNCGASDLSPTEIMEKCNEAMKPPIQYRIKVNNGVDSVLSQQHVLADGSVATRTETVILNMPRISVQSATDMYEWYPNSKICIDTQLINSAIKQQADDVKKMVVDIKSTPTLTARPNEVIVGKPCYVLDQEPSQEMLAAFKK